MDKKYIYILIIGVILFLLIVPLIAYLGFSFFVFNKAEVIQDNNKVIVNFEECIKEKDSVIQESYPRRCVLSDGTVFIEKIEEDNDEDKKNDSNVENKTIQVKLYLFDYNKFNEVDNSDYLTQVYRETTRKDVATFVLEEIIKGPNTSELSKNLRPTFGEGNHIWFTSQSNCSGKDFKISINNGVADVKMCRSTKVVGDISSTIVRDQIVRSLKQFSTINKVRVLDINDNCLDDMAGFTKEECVF